MSTPNYQGKKKKKIGSQRGVTAAAFARLEGRSFEAGSFESSAESENIENKASPEREDGA